MDHKRDIDKKMHEEQGREKLEKLQKKLNITKYNMEVSEQIMAQTPSDTEQKELTQKNERRRHGIAGIKKEIRDIEQVLEK